ncbi:hypothetical protein BBJ28_00021535 [Nothophytophthora sp. Chile5]|nr:hypothetical protein BBJ28_00021535 [Nothophytophthora sp. Chile5]
MEYTFVYGRNLPPASHIEGTTFSSLPDDMLDDMTALTFMHLGVHPQMTRLPSFRGLTRLKSLTLAQLFALIELPSFESLQHLERLVLVSLLTMESLPDFAPVKNLKAFVTTDRGAWCCNGFIGKCDLQNAICGLHPLWGAPAVSCTEKRATAATLAVTEESAATICGGVIMPGVAEGSPTEAGMEQCNGTLYRQCEEPGYAEAICYNARFMGIACSTSPFPVEMRRRQIAQGRICDSEYEAWLGCK